MSQKSPAAGGFLLMIAILVGFAVGVVIGQQLLGALAGTIVGTGLAIAVWLKDRRRTG